MRHLLNKLILVGGLLATTVAQAAYPDKQINLVVPFGAGGGTDVLGRLVADRLGRSLGVTVVVLNKPGAGGTIGTDFVAKAKPDGYTLLMGTNATLALAPGLYRNLPYDPVKDLTPVAPIASGPSILVVNPSIPATDVPSLIAYIKKNPGKLNYGSAGNGSTAHVATALFNLEAGLDAVHIPFKGGGAAIQELVAGRLEYMMAGPVESTPLIHAGRLRALAVTSPERFPGQPDLPTIAQAGLPGYEMLNWFGVFGPDRLPEEVTRALAPVLKKMVDDPGVRDALLKQGLQPSVSTPQEYREFVRGEVERWTKRIRQMNISIN
ncbi:Bug family tripartite tricarboxylate transporter substrate binding protein [Paralcaligenes ureilyticus]|uniref:Tripartite-type tricarboxylate transporter receptor subunit TctC n=1 Tax=Paralcaligenes ureilyticus TaxID=627131 RepID=A0A4R3M0R8_9BURK|nr:tripartite tricarboxylate transporter substrate binding protein [Paralcaligenes ureilyticus]TCT06313.1 tripartite-type tricarboxylate transporter receptor subunit TctC [Paralcaligenes ureilyticus]